MYKELLMFLFIILMTPNCFSQKTTQQASTTIKAYISKVGLDSISKADLFKENIILLDNKDYKVLRAEAYFYGGESFPSVLMQTIGTNNLNWIKTNGIFKAKTPFKITIGGIWCLNKNGKEELAQDFTLVVF
ncbi:MAG: hypothetical protein ABIN67_10160 [Ferruginibacter sp.]